MECIIFHDVDLVSENDQNMYTCAHTPKHISVLIDKFDYILPYDDLVGGVFALPPKLYKQLNGYSVS